MPWGDAEATSLLQRQMGADILVTGNTHKFEVGWVGGRARLGGAQGGKGGRCAAGLTGGSLG